MKTKLIHSINDCIRAAEQLKLPGTIQFIEEAAQVISSAFESGNKVILAGNGGSLCDASHFAEELTGFFRHHRRALPAIALSEPGHITCTANDMGFEWIFARGVEAYGQPGDVFVGLTTSGNSENIVKAFDTAHKRGLKTISFLGKGGGKLKGVANLELIVRDFPTSDRIQEVHMATIHLIIEVIEELLFNEKEAIQASF